MDSCFIELNCCRIRSPFSVNQTSPPVESIMSPASVGPMRIEDRNLAISLNGSPPCSLPLNPSINFLPNSVTGKTAAAADAGLLLRATVVEFRELLRFGRFTIGRGGGGIEGPIIPLALCDDDIR